MLSGGIFAIIAKIISKTLALIGIDILKTPAKETEVKNNDAKITVKPDSDGARDRLDGLQ